MDTNPNESVLREALRAARAQLDAVRAQNARLAAELDEHRGLEANLAQAVSSLQAILGPEKPDEPESVELVEAHTSEREADAASDQVVRTVVDGAVSPGPLLPQPTTLSRRVSPTSSPYRMGLILRDTQRPMTRDEAVIEYVRRGWVEDKWGDPEGAMTQALRRAVGYGWARRLDRNLYISTQTPDGQPAVGEVTEPAGALT